MSLSLKAYSIATVLSVFAALLAMIDSVGGLMYVQNASDLTQIGQKQPSPDSETSSVFMHSSGK